MYNFWRMALNKRSIGTCFLISYWLNVNIIARAPTVILGPITFLKTKAQYNRTTWLCKPEADQMEYQRSSGFLHFLDTRDLHSDKKHLFLISDTADKMKQFLNICEK